MLLRTVYYELKPVLPRRLRLALRRVRATWLRRRCADVWPINQAAGRAPRGWPGWPYGADFAFVLTHDVEEARGLARCRAMAEFEMALGFRSAFNFVPEGDYDTPKALRTFLRAHGFEVGVHDLHHDGRLYRNQSRFQRSAEEINRYLSEWDAEGFRSAFMLHDLEWLKALNVGYDASTFDTDPFEPQPDGVNTIFPFTVARDDGTEYVELPCTLAQDSTLFIVLEETSVDIWKRKLDWIASRGGMALMNVHPDYISFDDADPAEYSSAHYREFLDYLRTRYANRYWQALPGEIAHYVRQLSPVTRRRSFHEVCRSVRGRDPVLCRQRHGATHGQYHRP
jgi:hypothetical protein